MNLFIGHFTNIDISIVIRTDSGFNSIDIVNDINFVIRGFISVLFVDIEIDITLAISLSLFDNSAVISAVISVK